MIQPGQTYYALDGSGYRYRIEHHTPGSEILPVTDLATNKPKQIKAATLHDTPTTHDGQPRRTGYALEQS